MNSRPIDGRWLAAGVAIGYALLFWFSLRSAGLEATLLRAGVPSVGAPFSDLYVFPAAVQEIARGGNPYASNPLDPWQRPYNYPRAWLLFMRYPYAAVPWLGLGIDLAWLAFLWVGWGRLTRWAGLLAGAAACSPPVMLALERCNSDLLIFMLVGAALAALARGGRGAAWLGLFVATLLKLFPGVAFATFLPAAGRRAWGWLLAAAGGVLGWTFLRWDELIGITHNTPTGGPAISYGGTVIFTIADLLHQQSTGQWADYSAHRWIGSLAAGLVAVGLATLAFRRSAAPDRPFDRALACFQGGASIYVATFVLGSNFAYRGIFLLLCLPWLFQAEPACAWPNVRRAAAATLLVFLWANPQWWLPLIALREAASWTLVGLLAWLLGATLRPAAAGTAPVPAKI
jgi:hypothetical protein